MFSSVTQTASVTTGGQQVFSASGLTGNDTVVANAGTAEIYVSGTASPGTSGFGVPANGQLIVTGALQSLWAITSSGTASVTGTLGTDIIMTVLQDALMTRVDVNSTSAQVFDLYQYVGVAQTETPLAALGPSGDPALLTWPAFGPVLAGGSNVNPAGAGHVGDAVLINTGSVTVYVGSTSGVTTSTGVPVGAGHKLLLKGAAPSAVYAICASGNTSTMRNGLATLTALA